MFSIRPRKAEWHYTLKPAHTLSDMIGTNLPIERSNRVQSFHGRPSTGRTSFCKARCFASCSPTRTSSRKLFKEPRQCEKRRAASLWSISAAASETVESEADEDVDIRPSSAGEQRPACLLSGFSDICSAAAQLSLFQFEV